MIRDLAAYRRLRVADEERALQALDDPAAIALAEALLTSSVMDVIAPGPRPRPSTLARALGIDATRLRATKPARR